MQVQAFQCSAKCCQDQHSSQEVIQRCLSGCMQPVLEAEQKLKSEVEQLQVNGRGLVMLVFTSYLVYVHQCSCCNYQVKRLSEIVYQIPPFFFLEGYGMHNDNNYFWVLHKPALDVSDMCRPV